MQTTKRRSLVVTDERSRHPFLATLPPHVRAGGKAIAIPGRQAVLWQDARDFLIAYCACFLAVTAFIA